MTRSKAKEIWGWSTRKKEKTSHYFILFCVISDAQLEFHRSRSRYWYYSFSVFLALVVLDLFLQRATEYICPYSFLIEHAHFTCPSIDHLVSNRPFVCSILLLVYRWKIGDTYMKNIFSLCLFFKYTHVIYHYSNEYASNHSLIIC